MHPFRLTALPRNSHLRIGLLGGSFNPAHVGHLAISREALKRLQLDAVVWLVSPQNPLKAAHGASQSERLLAAAQFLRHEGRIHASGIEARFGTRYTIDTLRALRQRWPNARFVWLMGSDNLQQLPRWKQWRDLVRLLPIAVIERPPAPARILRAQAAQAWRRFRQPSEKAGALACISAPAWLWLPVRRHLESSTQIRNLLGKK